MGIANQEDVVWAFGHQGADEPPALFLEVLGLVHDNGAVGQRHPILLQIAPCLSEHVMPFPPVALRHRILVGGEHLPQTRALRPRELLTPPGAWNTQILLQGLDGVRLHDRLPLLSDKARIPLLNPSPRDGLVPAGGHFLVFGDSEQDAMLAQEVCCPGMQVDHLDPLDLVATE